MRAAVRRSALLSCLGLCWCLAPCCAAGPSYALEGGPAGGELASGPLTSDLVVVGSPVEGEQLRAQREAKLQNPEAVAEREASRTKFEHLDDEQARREAALAFPGTINEPAGGPPRLPAGQRIVGYPTDHAAQVALGDDERAVLESSEAMAVETSSGRREPLDLGLKAVGSGFEPTLSEVQVLIPQRLSDGVRLPAVGVALTPVDAQGAALGGSEGVVDGTSVVYANIQPLTDSDAVVKPTSRGFEADVLLRSIDSPRQLYFRVGLPAGAKLVQSRRSSGPVKVIENGVVIALIRRPDAEDAAGSAVPVSMSVRGGTLVVRLDIGSGKYQDPIKIDPEVVDEAAVLEEGVQRPSNFHFIHDGSEFRAEESGKGEEWRWYEWIAAAHKEHEWGALAYTTQGDSYLTGLSINGTWSEKGDHLENLLEMVSPKEVAEYKTILPEESLENHGWGIGNVAKPEHNNSAEYLTESNGTGAAGESVLTKALVSIGQETTPEVSFNTTSATVDGQPNAMYGTSNWLGLHTGAVEFVPEDKGIGIAEWATGYNSGGAHYLASKNLIHARLCAGIQCPEKVKEYITYSSDDDGLPNGEQELIVYAKNAFGSSPVLEHKVKVDTTPPSISNISGLGAGNEMGEGEYELKAEATDGLAGIKSLAAAVDGREVGKASGACSPGPCTVKGEWALNGGEFGAGEHSLTVTATDNAGNVTTETITLKVHHATPVSAGPGSVDPQSGEFSLSSTDVPIAVPGSNLTVTRSYRSRHLAAGSAGPLGPQWTLAVGGAESITKLPDGNATLTSASGAQATFVRKTGISGFNSPTGDANVALTEVKNEKGELTELVLADAADAATTRFTSTSGPTGSLWTPAKEEGPVAFQTVRYIYQTVEGVTEPVHVFAPTPAGVSCGEEIKTQKPGCRALSFEYAHETTATGEKPSEWHAYKGRLKEIVYTAYDPATREMETIPVAEYLYDAKGRLRAEWNPQITPALKTTYGYDGEGHVTAVSPAGQEPWLLHYGTIPGDLNSGRLLSLTRPAAASPTELKAQEEAAAPANTTLPSLSSSTPAVGTKISVSNEGTWSNGPLTYSYQWEDCGGPGKLDSECALIPGAVNQSYYPAKSDERYVLVALVTASNADGVTVAATPHTSEVASGTPYSPAPEPPAVGSSSVWTVEYQVPLSGASELGLPTMSKGEVEKWGQSDDPVEAAAIFPPDTPEGWPAKSYKRATLQYLDSDGRTVNVATPSGGVSTSEYNQDNDVLRTLSPDNRARALKETCEKEKCKSAELAKLLSTENTYEEKGSEPGTELLSTLGPQHTVELTNGEKVEARAHTVYSYNEGAPKEGGPYHLVTSTTQTAVVGGIEEVASQRTTQTSYSGTGSQEGLGWKLRKPISVTTDPLGLDLVHTTEYEPSTGNVMETKTPAATGKDAKVPPTYTAAFGAKGSEAGQLETPDYDAIDAHGDVWVVEYKSDRISEFSPSGAFMETIGWGVGSKGESKLEVCTSSCKAGIAGTGNGQFYAPAGIAIAGGDIYVVDSGNNRVEVLTEKGEYVTKWGSEGTGAGQFKIALPVAVSPSGDVWVGDSTNRRLEEFTSSGTFIEAIGWGVSNGKAEYEVCTSSCQAGIKGSGNGQFASIWGMAFAGSNLYVTDTGNDRVEEINEKSEYTARFGTGGTGNGQMEAPIGIAVSPTTGNLYVTDTGNNRMEVFTPAGKYLTQFGSAGTGSGQLDFPEGNAVNASGEVYVVDDLNHRVEKWVPTITGNEGAHDTKTVYYSAKEEAEVSTCRNHPEWAGLPCQTGPVTQPGGGLPELPVTTITAYNMWDEPETTVETVGSTTRTKTDTYDAAGRLKTTATTSTVGAALPTVSYGYTAPEGAAETGALTTESTTSAGKTEKLTSAFNTLGQLASYTDAAEKTTTYEYDVDGRIHKTNDGKGTEAFTYNEAGFPSELVNEYAASKLVFTATFDVEGDMLTETYPNGMTATYTDNPTGTATGLEYKKTTHCTEEKEKCKWFTDIVVPSIHGQWLSQTSSLSKQAYTYDAAGRITQVQNTPAGKGCTTRIYAYDEDTDRTSLTTREPNSKGECATEGGTIEGHTYDTADRLTDAGISYSTFGDIASLPAADSEKQQLTSTYYVDNQVDTQTQGEQTVGYNLDPAGRTLETIATGTKVYDVSSHYAGPGNSPAWTENTSGETTRNITGINGQIAAVQNNSESPVLQLANLHGDLIATAYLSETATELASKQDTSEFGVPTTSLPPKYSWLGAIELPAELPSGVINMGVRSYVPQLGRYLQPDPIPGGSADAYSYTFGDPVNTRDPSGEYVEAAYLYGFNDAENERAVEREAAREAAARAAAEAAAREAAAAEGAAGPQYDEQGEEWEEWWEEESGYEYTSYHDGVEGGDEEAHVRPAVLYQQFGEADEPQSGGRVPLCEEKPLEPAEACEAGLWHWVKHAVSSAVHAVGRWLSGVPPSNEVWVRPEPPFVEHAVSSVDDWLAEDPPDWDWP
jgi:RHS repeat-associated protein